MITRTSSPASEALRPAPAKHPLIPVSDRDLRVPLVTGETVPYTNLDHAASTPALQPVLDHLATILPHYSSIHRGAGYPSMVSTTLYESARANVAATLAARADDCVIFTRNTTDALNLLAHAIPDHGDVLYLDIEHHANQLAWHAREHRCLRAADTFAETLFRLDHALTQHPTALLAITGASNVTGELVPLAPVVSLAHAHGTRVVVDAAQLAPHRRIDLAASDIDYVAFSGHKLYAPFGAGVLAGRRDWLDQAPPYLGGGGAVRQVTAHGVDWADSPQRHEAGTPNLLGAVALATAHRLIVDLGEETIRSHEYLLRTRLVEGLLRHPAVSIHRIWNDSSDSIGIVTFSVQGYDPGHVAAYLSAEHGIGVRDGRFCAHPLLARLAPTSPGGAVRASFGLSSTTADVDHLLDAIETLLGHGPRWRYSPDAGRWTPQPDPRPLPAWAARPGSQSSTTPCQQTPPL